MSTKNRASTTQASHATIIHFVSLRRRSIVVTRVLVRLTPLRLFERDGMTCESVARSEECVERVQDDLHAACFDFLGSIGRMEGEERDAAFEAGRIGQTVDVTGRAFVVGDHRLGEIELEGFVFPADLPELVANGRPRRDQLFQIYARVARFRL